MPGDILCTVLGQNVGQGQTIMGQANYSWYFWCYCFASFLKKHIKTNFKETSKVNQLAYTTTKLKRQEVTRVTKELLHPVYII